MENQTKPGMITIYSGSGVPGTPTAYYMGLGSLTPSG